MKKLAAIAAATGLFWAGAAHAICPVCTVAVAGGIGLAKWLGIDDTVTGVWIGGLTISLSMWTADWCVRRKIVFPRRDAAIAAAYYGMIVVPLYFMGYIGHPLNKLWGVDKLVLGIVVGSVAFAAAARWYLAIKSRRGRAMFPFQKVAMPVGALTVLSGVFYILSKRFG